MDEGARRVSTALRLRHVASLRVEPSTAPRPLLNLDQIESGTGRLIDALRTSEPDGAIRFEPGDVLFSKLRPYLAKSVLVTTPMHGTGELLPIVANPEAIDHRFLFYVTLGRPWLDHAEMTSYGTKMPRTSCEAMRNFVLPNISLGDQRRIADLLDDQVARIDKIITARRQQSLDAETSRWNAFTEQLRATAAPVIPLRRVIAFIADGPFGSAFSSSDYVEDGPAVIRLGNIGFAEFKSADLARVPSSIYRQFPRCHVSPGDVLVASLGDARNHAGRACIAPAFVGPAMVKGKCFRAQVFPHLADPSFIAVLLSSPLGVESIVRFGRGATRTMINIDLLMSAVFPVPPLSSQIEIVWEFNQLSAEVRRFRQSCDRSTALHGDLKRSLITAAVTGEFDVSSANRPARVPV
jgi:type I restriction enzyme S subunit